MTPDEAIRAELDARKAEVDAYRAETLAYRAEVAASQAETRSRFDRLDDEINRLAGLVMNVLDQRENGGEDE